nr:alpha/beta hydrolase [uncultured Sphingomonas sp.]
MLRRDILLAGVGTLIAATISTRSAEGSTTMKTSKGQYASVNGIDLYYERHGTGEPLILLHGGLGTIDAIFGRLLPALAARRQVIAVELQGHGHTADNGRPMTYAAMADDVAALIAKLGFERADVAGYSVGGGVTLQLGLRHPDKVRKLVVISAPHATKGWFPEVLAGTSAMDPEAMKGSKWHQAYAKVAPKPEDWPLLVRNVSRLMSSSYDWSAAIAERMKAPILVINGDADSVRPGHALALYELMGGGKSDGFATGRGTSQLLIVPDTNHLEILDREVLAPAMLAYLERDQAVTPPFSVRS